MFENRVLRWIPRSKRDEVTGRWRKLHNRQLNDFYSPPNRPTIIMIESVWIRLEENVT
jgi:hypothetical protein